MATTKSKAKLEAELEEAQDYITELEAKLDDIAGIAGGDTDSADDDENQDDDPDYDDEEDEDLGED